MTGTPIIPFPADGAARNQRKRLARLRGTDAHAAALAQRERDLGLDAVLLAQSMLAASASTYSSAAATSPARGETPPPLPPFLSRPARTCGDPERHLAAWVYREADRRFVCGRCFPPDTPCPVCHATRWQPYTARGPAAAASSDPGQSGQPGGHGFVCGACHPAPVAL